MTISLSDFNNLSEKEKKKTLENLKNEIGVSGMVKAWNVSRSKVYSMLHEFDIAVGSKKHRLKPKKPTKTATGAKSKNESITPSPVETPQKAETADVKNFISSSSNLGFDLKDDAKFSLYLETQGTASFINETVQLLLGSQKLTGSNLQVNISLQEI